MRKFFTPDVLEVTHKLIPIENIIPETVYKDDMESFPGLKSGKRNEVVIANAVQINIFITTFIQFYLIPLGIFPFQSSMLALKYLHQVFQFQQL